MLILCGLGNQKKLVPPGKLLLLWQADRGFARSRLFTYEDGNTNNLVLYTVRNDTSKKGGNALGLRIKREREEYVGILIFRKPH